VAQGVPGRLGPRISLTFRHYKGGSSSAKRTGRLYPRRNPWYSLSEAESASWHKVLSGVPRKKSPVTPPGIDPGTSRLVTQCFNHYATPGHTLHITELITEIINNTYHTHTHTHACFVIWRVVGCTDCLFCMMCVVVSYCTVSHISTLPPLAVNNR